MAQSAEMESAIDSRAAESNIFFMFSPHNKRIGRGRYPAAAAVLKGGCLFLPGRKAAEMVMKSDRISKAAPVRVPDPFTVPVSLPFRSFFIAGFLYVGNLQRKLFLKSVHLHYWK